MTVVEKQLAAMIERDLFTVLTGHQTNTVAAATDTAMTFDKLKAAMSELRGLMPPARTEIVFSAHALETTTERLFPASVNRSKRIHKKLVKRFGGEFRRRPAMYRIGDTIYAHPSFRSQLEAQFPKETRDVQMHTNYQNPILRQTWL